MKRGDEEFHWGEVSGTIFLVLLFFADQLFWILAPFLFADQAFVGFLSLPYHCFLLLMLVPLVPRKNYRSAEKT